MKAVLFQPLPHWSRHHHGLPQTAQALTKDQCMKKRSLTLLAIASVTLALGTSAAENYAARVVSYDPGAGFSTGYTHEPAVLGEPSRVNPWGDTVEPFNPPYTTNQVLSLGAGGSVTIEFDRAVMNAPHHPFGVDFIIFGNSGFIVTNDFDSETFGWIGTPATDGSLFAHNTGTTRVSVSKDGKRFFELKPDRAPFVDVLFPTDSSGRFDLPVNPELTAEDFAGATVETLREMYRGSAGGASYSIGWARTTKGRPAELPFIRYVRVEVIEGKAEIDGFSAVGRRQVSKKAAIR